MMLATAAFLCSLATVLSLRGIMANDETVLFRAQRPACAMTPEIDYDGEAVRWGLAPAEKMASWHDCCAACLAKRKPKRCTHWVFCPQALCWSPDVWNHTQGECWLKWFDATKQDAPTINFQGAYEEAFRAIHKTAPRAVQWVGGIVTNGSEGAVAAVDG